MRCKICGKKIDAGVSGILTFVNGKVICTECSETVRTGKKLEADKTVNSNDAVVVEVKPTPKTEKLAKAKIEPKPIAESESVSSADTEKDTPEPTPESKPVEEEGTIDL